MDDARNTSSRPSISIIVPTYKEAANLPHLIERVDRVRADNGLALELLIMDDNSRDGSEEAVQALGMPWVRFVVRRENRGLSPAVLDGMRMARNDVLLVMDADLSHPPEKIPDLVDTLCGGSDFVIGSRYVEGAGTDAEWGLFRWVNSKVATVMARPFTRAKDPMSGFFALRRERFENAADLNPIGYKIGLELLVKCGCANVTEVPIYFADRQLGESKLTFAEQLRYIQHVRRLFIHKFGGLAHFAQFAVVGSLGTLVNLAVLTILHMLRVPLYMSVAVAIFTAMVFNFALNRRFTFSYARAGSVRHQFVGFVGASCIGALVNYATTLGALALWPALQRLPQVAAIMGIAAGMVFNYAISRHLVFRKPGARGRTAD